MRVTYYHRRPQGASFSIERLFSDVRRALPKCIDARVAVSRFPSRGLWGRVYNIIEAVFRQGEVNHITGDVHFLALLLRRDKTILTIHDLVLVNRLRGIRRSLYLILWYWLPIKRSAILTVVSESTKQELLRHVKLDPMLIRVVHDPISTAFEPVPKKFNHAKPVILQVGTGPNKNIDRVAEALMSISCHLRVIGCISDHQKSVLQHYNIDYSSVEHITDEDVVIEYRQSDMLVFVSTYEGFGLPIVEAQATGRPVITSNLLSMPEVAGEAACLVDPYDVKSIRNGILKVIENPEYREELVRRGYENIERFRPNVIAEKYVDIYRLVAKSCG